MKYIILLLATSFIFANGQNIKKEQKRIKYLAQKIRYYAKDQQVVLVNLMTKRQQDNKNAQAIEIFIACTLGNNRVNIDINNDIPRNSKHISNNTLLSTNAKYLIVGKYSDKKNKHKVYMYFFALKNGVYRKIFSHIANISLKIKNIMAAIKTPSKLNLKIVKWVKQNIGHQIGNGECWTLIAGALAYNDARHPSLIKYGIQIPMEYITSGDMIQYNGYLSAKHSAIVVKVINIGIVNVAHQNAPPNGKKVGILMQNFLPAKNGTVLFFRPIKK